MNTPDTLLIFRVAGIACAVPAQQVSSILMPPAHLTHPPGSDRSTPGIFHHAEHTYAVLDLHERFGIDEPRRGSGRLLLQDEGLRHYAFLVDEIVGLVRSEQGRWAGLPPYLPRDIFWSGFLYREEIVLCTELSLLRAMHDAAPLRRHFETLQQSRQSVQPEARKTDTPKAGSAPSAPPRREEPGDKPPRPREVVKKAPPQRTKPAAPAAPATPERPPASAPPLTPRPAVEKPLPARANVTHRSAPPAPRHPAFQTTTDSAQAPHRRDTTPPPLTDATPLWPWLLVALLLLAGYWIWSISNPVSVAKPRPRPAAVPALIEPPKAAAPAPVVSPVPVGAPPPQSDTPPDKNETTQATEPVAPPLRIERDGEGTINLIIDRQAILASRQHSTNPLQGIPLGGIATQTPQQSDAGAQEGPTPGGAEPVAQEAATLAPQAPRPDAPEPCDCTHIVVPGDTLWDIAEHYTGNAFNYPELARRSGIRNPDRIYPGDKVRIIIR